MSPAPTTERLPTLKDHRVVAFTIELCSCCLGSTFLGHCRPTRGVNRSDRIGFSSYHILYHIFFLDSDQSGY
jgi:hypothetical protein